LIGLPTRVIVSARSPSTARPNGRSAPDDAQRSLLESPCPGIGDSGAQGWQLRGASCLPGLDHSKMELNIHHRSSVEEATARPQHKRGKLRPRPLYKPERFTSHLHPTHHDENPRNPTDTAPTPNLSAAGSDVQNPSPSNHFATGTKRRHTCHPHRPTPSHVIDRSTTSPSTQPQTRSGPLAADEHSPSPRTTPQMTPSTRGDHTPSFRRSWSSLTAPRGRYKKQ